MNSKMDGNLTSMWVNFFTAAGIPSDVSATYALTFTENRIQNDMLLDLNKEYLRDMGIVRMGDVIAILRHAKQVHESTARDKVLSTTITTSTVAVAKVPVAAITGRSTVTSQPSSPASRILEHYTRNPQAPESPNSAQVLKRKSVESGTNTEAGIKKARSIRFAAAPAKPTIKEGAVNKTVFARLGTSESKPVSTNTTVKPIYARLGNKSEEQAIPIDKDALKYEGILKANPEPKKIVTVTTSKNVRKISCTMRADEAPISVKEKLNIPKALPKSVKFSNHVQYKEIEPNQKTSVKAKATAVFNKPERRLSMPDSSANSVKARLGTVGTKNVTNLTVGTKNVNNLTITRNVFNRLGV